MSETIELTDTDHLDRSWTISAMPAVSGFRYTVYLYMTKAHRGAIELELMYPGGVANGWVELDLDETNAKSVLRRVAQLYGVGRLGHKPTGPAGIRDRQAEQDDQLAEAIIDSYKRPGGGRGSYRSVFAADAKQGVRGTEAHPCEDCGQTTYASSSDDGFFRCNQCGYPGK